ncbi:MAG: sigma-70 family RNA polymerase sigma factor [Phycisphaerae bacterium]
MIAKLPNDETAEVPHGTRSLVPTAKPPGESVLAGFSLADRELLSQILATPCEYVEDPSFRKPGIETALFGRPARLPRPDATYFSETPAMLAETDRGEARASTLNVTQEQLLFRRLNYARRQMYRILAAHAGKRLSGRQTRMLLAWAHRSLMARSEIVQANVPLVLAMAKRTRLSGVDFGDLISEGNMALLRSVDKFDCSRGFKFSTYSCRAILKSFSRVAMRTSRYRGRFPTEFDPTLEKSDFLEHKRDDVVHECISELRDILNNNLADLSDIEQTVIRERFALAPSVSDQPATPKTLEQVGALIGVTKERVRQIQNKALQKIRIALEESILAA